MKSKTIVAILALMLLPIAEVCVAAWSWTPFMGLTDNYFHPTSPGSSQPILVVVTDQNFHSCGWNAAANLNSTVVGDAQFKVFTSAVLAAWMGGKSISLLIDGCDGDRAKVFGVRISK